MAHQGMNPASQGEKWSVGDEPGALRDENGASGIKSRSSWGKDSKKHPGKPDASECV